MLKELIRPLSFLSIKHDGPTIYWITWGVPGFIAAVCLCALLFFGVRLNVYGETGLLAKILGFVQSLPGFYLAALAAVATFNNPGMDKLLPGVPPTAKIIHNGKLTTVKLTRRRFLSMMFAFLTAVSFALTFAAILGINMAEPLKLLFCEPFIKVAHYIFLGLFLLFLCQMLVVTMWGLFYLGERVHTPD